MKLDIACGSNKHEGFTGIDIAKIEGVDIVHDLEKYPWPIKKASVEEAWCSHYVEHVRDLMKFMNELYRVMQDDAKATIIAPYYTSIRSMQDPTHVRPISEASFLYFNRAWRVENRLDHYPITCDFDYVFGYSYTPEWQNRSDDARAFAVRNYWNVVSDIQVVLTKRSIKG